MRLVSMSDYRSRDTVDVLKYLLSRAKKGELKGVAVMARLATEGEEILFTDWYRRRMERCAYAATRMYWRAMQNQDEIEDSRNFDEAG